MTWQQWNSGTPVIPGLTGIVNPAPVVNPTGVLPPGAQYTPEQWAQMQQQNWQQWAQWQQQYQQWHQQYGAEYQKSMTALSQASMQPPMPNTSVPPPLPPEVKPPQPPDEPVIEERSFSNLPQPNFSAPPPSFQPPNNQNKNPSIQPTTLKQPQINQPQMNQPQMNQPQMNQPQMKQPQMNQQPSYNYNRNNNHTNRNFGNYQQNRNNPTKPPSLMSLSVKKPELGKDSEPKRMKIDHAHPQNANTKVEASSPISKVDVVPQNAKVDTDAQSTTSSQANEDLSETEKKFIKQFTEWEAQFNKWKEQNVNHPDKEQYREYEKKWETWRAQLLERREQMRRKRLGLLDNQKPSTATLANVNQPKMENTKKASSNVGYESHETEVKDDGSSFLKLTSSDGIPGLDLVGDATDEDIPPSKEESVIELDKSPDRKKGEPDLEAISKGINSILGDQKLLSMLSMVSQNQKIQPSSSFTNTTSGIHETKTSEKELNETSSQGGWSNPGDEKNFDKVSNYDDQSRSSYGGKQEQDWNNAGYDQDYDNRSNSNNSKPPVFRGRNQENYRDPDYFQAPDSFSGPDNFQSPNKPGRPSNFQPPNIFHGADNLRGQANFRGPNNQGDQDNFRSPDNFRSAGNFQGPDNSTRGADNFQGPNNNFRGQDRFQPPDNCRGGDNFTSDHFRGPNTFGRQDNFREPDKFHGVGNFQGRGSFQSSENFHQNDYEDDEDYHQDDFEGQEVIEEEDFRQNNFRGNNFQGGERAFEQPGNFQNRGNFGRPNFQNQNFRGNFIENNSEFDNNMGQGDEEYHDDNYDYHEEEDESHNQFSGNDRNGDTSTDFGAHHYDDHYEDGDMQGYDAQTYDMEHCPDAMDAPVDESEQTELSTDAGDVPPVENPMWQPTNVIEYEHKSQKSEDIRVSIEPLRTFDYRHKPVNRIPLPQRPDWLKKMLRNCREFDFVISRYDQPSYSRYPSDRYERYSDNTRFVDRGDDKWRRDQEDRRRPNEFRTGNRRLVDSNPPRDYGYDSKQMSPPRAKYEEPQRVKYEEPQRGKYDEQRGKYEEPERGKYEEGQKVKYEEPQRGKYDDLQRGRFEEPLRGKYDDQPRPRYEEPQRLKFEEPQRMKYDDGLRGRYEEPQRGKYEEPLRGKFEEPLRGKYEEPPRGKFEEPLKGKFEEPPRGKSDEPLRGRYEEPQRGWYDEQDKPKYEEPKRFKYEEAQRGRFEEPANNAISDKSYGRDIKEKEFIFGRESDEFNKGTRSKDGANKEIKDIKMSPPQQIFPTKSITLIEDILNPPGRFSRPARLVIILRGPPGSGKTFLAKLIKDKEVENGGSAPRILSLDDYFMVEQEKEVDEDGKKTKIKVMEYEYDGSMETVYRNSLFKAFKKTITDGYFPFIIVDNINDKVKYFGEMWSFAKQNGFQVYVCQLEFDLATCTKRNVHTRSEMEIQKIISSWEPTPSHHPSLDATSLVQSASIPEVEMEEINSPPSDDFDDSCAEEKAFGSKWDNFDCSLGNLAKLDGTNKPLRTSKTMEDYLQIDDDWVSRESKPGQKRVRWADLEERKKQQKMRAIGFVVGQTNWDRMMDPTMGSSALTQTKYIERVPRFYRD